MTNFDYSSRLAPRIDTKLSEGECQVVFSSHLPEGFDGHQYVIRDTKDFEKLRENIDRFIVYAKSNPNTNFLVVNGYPMNFYPNELAPLFWNAKKVTNIFLTKSYWEVLLSDDYSVKHPLFIQYELFSNQIRFGYGIANNNGIQMYFAFHGCPNQNDDYYTLTEITELEFAKLKIHYKHGSWGHEVGDKFCKEFIDNHTVYYEGWMYPNVIWIK